VPIFRHRNEWDVTKGPIISGDPFVDPAVGTDRLDHERIVEFTRAETRFEAEVLVAALQSRGITAAATHASGHAVDARRIRLRQ
jgi:hypothetical protein